jgi:hypothetical protein
MSKSFKTAPTPQRQPTNDQILAFVAGGQKAPPVPAPAPVAVAAPVTVAEKTPTARLSLDLPADLHSRFKAACARSRLKMTAELLAFIERRTTELEGKW